MLERTDLMVVPAVGIESLGVEQEVARNVPPTVPPSVRDAAALPRVGNNWRAGESAGHGIQPLATRTSRSFFSRADVQKIKLASKDRESGQNHGRPVTLQSSHPIRAKL